MFKFSYYIMHPRALSLSLSVCVSFTLALSLCVYLSIDASILPYACRVCELISHEVFHHLIRVIRVIIIIGFRGRLWY